MFCLEGMIAFCFCILLRKQQKNQKQKPVFLALNVQRETTYLETYCVSRFYSQNTSPLLTNFTSTVLPVRSEPMLLALYQRWVHDFVSPELTSSLCCS